MVAETGVIAVPRSRCLRFGLLSRTGHAFGTGSRLRRVTTTNVGRQPSRRHYCWRTVPRYSNTGPRFIFVRPPPPPPPPPAVYCLRSTTRRHGRRRTDLEHFSERFAFFSFYNRVRQTFGAATIDFTHRRYYMFPYPRQNDFGNIARLSIGDFPKSSFPTPPPLDVPEIRFTPIKSTAVRLFSVPIPVRPPRFRHNFRSNYRTSGSFTKTACLYVTTVKFLTS